MNCVRVLWGLCFAASLCAGAPSQTWPLTRAEKSSYNETSHYADVVEFLKDLQRAGAPLDIQMIGTSAEGKEMPLAIASFPRVSSAAEARRLGKPIVYIQANIHAGEVEGKEAALIVLRRLCQEGPKGLLGKVVLLVTPIYNIDGNEKFGPVAVNRPEQAGPAMVGVRPNGQGFDLNRDAIKGEAPETQAVLRHVYNTWDPDVMMDLHTTDGTRHGWELTYSPPLNPDTDPEVMKFTRDQLIPSVRNEIRDRTGLPLFDYGNVETRQQKRAWYTFEEKGRYCTNYVGLRNRIAVLSEATTYIPFKARVEITDKFVSAILGYVVKHSQQVLAITRGADARVVSWGEHPGSAPKLGVRFDFESRGVEPVLLEKKPANGMKAAIDSRPAKVEPVKMPIYDRFKAVKWASFPAAYVIPASETKTVELLAKHGIVVEKLLEGWDGPAQSFRISEVKVAARAFQGRKLMEMNGAFTGGSLRAEAGDYLVRTAQPLGILAFTILEPESLDGAMAWGFLGTAFKPEDTFPIAKIFIVPAMATIRN